MIAWSLAFFDNDENLCMILVYFVDFSFEEK